MAKKLSRRQFLLIGAAGTAALLVPDLSACSPTNPETAKQAAPEMTSTVLPAPTPTALPTLPPAVSARPAACRLSPAIVPTRPADTPGYTQLDPATGLHMTGTPVDIDINSYRLKVFGKVNNPLELTYDELRCMPKVTTKSTSICVGYFEDRATWAGVPFAHILDLVNVRPEATIMTLRGADGFFNGILIEAARLDGAYLAYEWEGQPVPVLHGFPLRAIYVSDIGSYRVKWVLEIELS